MIHTYSSPINKINERTCRAQASTILTHDLFAEPIQHTHRRQLVSTQQVAEHARNDQVDIGSSALNLRAIVSSRMERISAVRRRTVRAGPVAAIGVPEPGRDGEGVGGDERDIGGGDSAVRQGELDESAASA